MFPRFVLISKQLAFQSSSCFNWSALLLRPLKLFPNAANPIFSMAHLMEGLASHPWNSPHFSPSCYFARRSGWVNSGEFSRIARTASSPRRAIVSSRHRSRPPDARLRRPVCLMLMRNLIITVDWRAALGHQRRVKCEKHRIICQWARWRWNDQDQICWQGRTQIRPKMIKIGTLH